MASIIKVQNLRKVYRVGKEKVVALDDICLEIGEGEMCCIVGASGSGKSTLLNQLAGLEKPTKGRVLIGKHDISAMTDVYKRQVYTVCCCKPKRPMKEIAFWCMCRNRGFYLPGMRTAGTVSYTHLAVRFGRGRNGCRRR